MENQRQSYSRELWEGIINSQPVITVESKESESEDEEYFEEDGDMEDCDETPVKAKQSNIIKRGRKPNNYEFGKSPKTIAKIIQSKKWKFGKEPTFMVNPKFIPPALKNMTYKDGWNNTKIKFMYEEYSQAITDFFSSTMEDKLKHKWRNNCSKDESSIEIPTPTYVDFELFKKDYASLTKELDKFGFCPSSITDMETEGGCHQNFDLEWMKEQLGIRFTVKFLRNLIAYINMHPYIVWTFLAPNDNASSALKNSWNLESFNKGDFLTIRDLDSYDFEENLDDEINDNKRGFNDMKYMELRFFMMPRSFEEMVLHHDFAISLLNFIAIQTSEGIEYKLIDKYTVRKDLTKIKFEQCNIGMRKVCKEIGFSFLRINKACKMELVEERISYGAKWMI